MRGKVTFVVGLLALIAAWLWANNPDERAVPPSPLTPAEIQLCAAVRSSAPAAQWIAIENAGQVRTALRVAVSTGDRAGVADACRQIGA
jgi:hypothetical protein